MDPPNKSPRPDVSLRGPTGAEAIPSRPNGVIGAREGNKSGVEGSVCGAVNSAFRTGIASGAPFASAQGAVAMTVEDWADLRKASLVAAAAPATTAPAARRTEFGEVLLGSSGTTRPGYDREPAGDPFGRALGAGDVGSVPDQEFEVMAAGAAGVFVDGHETVQGVGCSVQRARAGGMLTG